MTHYTEEQIMIRSMPCPECGARPRQHCFRKPKQNGLIINHQDRQMLWHDFVKSVNAQGRVDLYNNITWSIPRKEHQDQFFVIDRHDKF